MLVVKLVYYKCSVNCYDSELDPRGYLKRRKQVNTEYSLEKSAKLYNRALNSLSGGVNSNVRLSEFPHPLFYERAQGARIFDVDGNEYIDYVLGQGPMIFGHSPQFLLHAVAEASMKGQVFAGQHLFEVEAAEMVKQLVPNADLVRFASSGTESVEAALRLARAYTRRNKIIKFEYSTVNSMFISDQITDKFIEFGSGKSTDRLNFRCPIIELTEELEDIIVSNQPLTITGKLNEINEITGFLNPCKIYVPPKILPTPTPIPTWIDAKTVIDQFNENSNYYSQFYENKHLEIFGNVFDHGKNMRGLPYLEFGSNRVIERIKIKCDTVSKSNTSYTDGSEIIARGTFTKFHGNRIILDECEINSK